MSKKNIHFFSDMPKPDYMQIGRWSYCVAAPNIRFATGKDRIIIGAFCSMARDVEFLLGGEHPTNWLSTYPFFVFTDDWPNRTSEGYYGVKGDIVIGNDVWIGTGVTILSGVTIGDGAIIGANALVTKDVEPYTIVGGNPAKPIRKRFDEETIAMFLEIKWWEWPDEIIREYTDILCSPNVEALKEAAKQVQMRLSAQPLSFVGDDETKTS